MGIRQDQVLTWLDIKNPWLSKAVNPEYVIEISIIRYGKLCDDKAKDGVVKDQKTPDYRFKEL